MEYIRYDSLWVVMCNVVEFFFVSFWVLVEVGVFMFLILDISEVILS